MIRLPGVCACCRADVAWTGKRWQGAPVRLGKGRTHVCTANVRCGAWMPYAREHCARLPGHRWEHRTEYAMRNARMA